jgi:hypothetical protein
MWLLKSNGVDVSNSPFLFVVYLPDVTITMVLAHFFLELAQKPATPKKSRQLGFRPLRSP